MTPHFTCSNTKLIVDKEMKKAFDEALAFLLQNSVHTTQKMKAGKKSLKIASLTFPRTVANLDFDYLSGQKAYYFSITCSSGEFESYISDVAPPYPSNKPPDLRHDFSMSTLMETRGVFSWLVGIIYLSTAQNMERDINHIQNCLNEHYIPKIENFLTFSPSLIDDIIENPDFYSFPAPLMAFTMRINSIRAEDLKVSLGKKILKNSIFDKNILGL